MHIFEPKSTLADFSNIILYLSYFSLDKPSTGSILKIAWSADGTQVNKYIKDPRFSKTLISVESRV